MIEITIKQKHVKHSIWNTCVTVGKGKSKKQFGLKNMGSGRFRVFFPFGSSNFGDFDSSQEAIEFCKKQ